MNYDKKKITGGILYYNQYKCFSEEFGVELMNLTEKATLGFTKRKGFDIDDLRQVCIIKCLSVIQEGKVRPETAASYLYKHIIFTALEFVRENAKSRRVYDRLYNDYRHLLNDDSYNIYKE